MREFWPQAPAAWFAVTELAFEVAGITQEREKFAHAVGILRNVMDLVETPPEVNAYTTLKSQVLAMGNAPAQHREVQLRKFWPQAPAAWFGVTELAF